MGFCSFSPPAERSRLGFLSGWVCEPEKHSASRAFSVLRGAKRPEPRRINVFFLFDRLAPLVTSFRAQDGFERVSVGIGRRNSATPPNARALPQEPGDRILWRHRIRVPGPRRRFLPRPRGQIPTSRAGPRPTTLRLERQVARLRVGARRHGGSVSYRPKSNFQIAPD